MPPSSYDDIDGIADLPEGWTDEQDGGTYRVAAPGGRGAFRLRRRPALLEAFPASAASPSVAGRATPRVHRLHRDPGPTTPFAFIGVRSCDLHAIAIQDRVFLGGGHVDPHYQAGGTAPSWSRSNCGEAGGTCFCVSMGTGPKASVRLRLALTELIDDRRPRLPRRGRQRTGSRGPRRVPHRQAAGRESRRCRRLGRRAYVGQYGPRDATDDIHGLLLAQPRASALGRRRRALPHLRQLHDGLPDLLLHDRRGCDATSPATRRSGRGDWDSCFTDGLLLHPWRQRAGLAASRYRQWMTHKLATWIDQFGTSGCVGCGRCITWCPVGIDITEEVRAIREQPAASEATA